MEQKWYQVLHVLIEKYFDNCIINTEGLCFSWLVNHFKKQHCATKTS